MEFCTAVSSAASAPPPRDTFATEGPEWFRVTQSMPATTWAVVPEPELLSTRTATILAFLATPYAVPAAVAATWVPWPLPSCAVLSPSTAS